jgi:hypothetical protein
MTNLHLYALRQKLASSLKLVSLYKIGVIKDASAAKLKRYLPEGKPS